MESSEPVSVPNPDTVPQLGFQSPPSSDHNRDPPTSDPDATVESNLGEQLHNLNLKGTDETQNSDSKENHHSQNLGLKENDDAQNLHLKETHEAQNVDLKETHEEAQNVDSKETREEAQNLDLKETHESLEAQNVDLKETHHEGSETGEKAGKDSNEEENGESHESYEEDKNENGNEGEKVGADGDVDGDGEALKNEEGERSNRGHLYPLRPEAEDCAYYMKTGTCKFGSNCKFNHPVRRKSQAPKEKVMEKEELAERPGQTECKYYLRTGGCKFGKACRYHHPRGKITVAPILELNFLGLPIRLGEKECPYYMRTGSCKYGANCRFNHPDPTSAGGGDPSGYVNGGSVSLQGASPSTITSWTSPKTLNETPPFVSMMFQPTQGVPSQTPEWNGYQAPVYPPERSMHPPPAYVMSPATETNVYTHQQQQMLLEEFPERPGQPECSYFLKTGDCKFKSNCKYHHPKARITRSPPCPLSDKGLPLRPDQNICTHYSRYGICKFGPACKFDHPVHHQALSGLGHPPSFGNSMTAVGARMVGSGNEAAIQ